LHKGATVVRRGGVLSGDHWQAALRPKEFEVPLGEKRLDVSSSGPLAMRFLVAAIVQAVSTHVMVTVDRDADVGRLPAVDHP
jgi:hypothetical protein